MSRRGSASAFPVQPTARQTLVRTLGLAGLVLVVGGTAIALRPGDGAAGDLGTGTAPGRAIALYVPELRVAPHASARDPEIVVRPEAAAGSAYRMDASEIDAKFAVLAAPARGECCWRPVRLSWHDATSAGEIALPIAYVPALRADAARVEFGTLERFVPSANDARALRLALLSRQPMIATVDVADPERPRLYDLRPASDAEIARHDDDARAVDGPRAKRRRAAVE